MERETGLEPETFSLEGLSVHALVIEVASAPGPRVEPECQQPRTVVKTPIAAVVAVLLG
jgi:hypothetical protein